MEADVAEVLRKVADDAASGRYGRGPDFDVDAFADDLCNQLEQVGVDVAV